MIKFLRLNFAILLLAFFGNTVFAQTPQKIEQELINLYAKVDDNSGYKSNNDSDLLEKANDDFKTKVLEYTKIASTLKYTFGELQKEITITTSEDGKFRAYSWDRLDGGTMHFFETVYQFQTKDGKVHSQAVETEEGNAGGFVQNIFNVETKLGNVYLVCSYAIGSTQDRYEGVGLFRIDGNKLNDSVKLFKTKSGITNSIGFSYNFFSVLDKKKNSEDLIIYDKKTKVLKIPVVVENEKFQNGEVTDKFISYKFNGTYFVKVN
jgi:hypothetical protein